MGFWSRIAIFRLLFLMIWPESVSSFPSMARNKVDLPDPLIPTMASFSPSLIEKSRFVKSFFSPMVLESLDTETSTMSMRKKWPHSDNLIQYGYFKSQCLSFSAMVFKTTGFEI